MKIVCIAMVKNELDVINDFLYQCERLFDEYIIIDHNSNDGTEQILKNWESPKFRLCSLYSCGYPQSEVMTIMARKVLSRDREGWLFLLDVDEYLLFSNRTELENYLEKKSSYDIIKMYWNNAVPKELSIWHGFAKTELLISRKVSTFPKIVLNMALNVNTNEIEVWQGNHGIAGNAPLNTYEEKNVLLHVPFRNRFQFMKKLITGNYSYYKRADYLKNNMGFHWKEMLEKYIDSCYNDVLIYNYVYYYSEKLDEINENYCELFSEPKTISFLDSGRESKFEVMALFVDMLNILKKASEDEGNKSNKQYLIDEDGLVYDLSKSEQCFVPNQKQQVDILPVNLSAILESCFYCPKSIFLSNSLKQTTMIPLLDLLFYVLKPQRYLQLGFRSAAEIIAAAELGIGLERATEIKLLIDNNLNIDQYSELVNLRELLYRFPNISIKETGEFTRINVYDNERFDIIVIYASFLEGRYDNEVLNWITRISSRGVLILIDDELPAAEKVKLENEINPNYKIYIDRDRGINAYILIGNSCNEYNDDMAVIFSPGNIRIIETALKQASVLLRYRILAETISLDNVLCPSNNAKNTDDKYIIVSNG